MVIAASADDRGVLRPTQTTRREEGSVTELMIGIVVRAQNGVYRLRDEERAQTLTEYALIIAVIALGVLVALYVLRDQLKGFFSKAGSSVQNA
jgi:Flp pilus assembly pilin Flp